MSSVVQLDMHELVKRAEHASSSEPSDISTRSALAAAGDRLQQERTASSAHGDYGMLSASIVDLLIKAQRDDDAITAREEEAKRRREELEQLERELAIRQEKRQANRDEIETKESEVATTTNEIKSAKQQLKALIAQSQQKEARESNQQKEQPKDQPQAKDKASSKHQYQHKESKESKSSKHSKDEEKQQKHHKDDLASQQTAIEQQISQAEDRLSEAKSTLEELERKEGELESAEQSLSNRREALQANLLQVHVHKVLYVLTGFERSVDFISAMASCYSEDHEADEHPVLQGVLCFSTYTKRASSERNSNAANDSAKETDEAEFQRDATHGVGTHDVQYEEVLAQSGTEKGIASTVISRASQAQPGDWTNGARNLAIVEVPYVLEPDQVPDISSKGRPGSTGKKSGGSKNTSSSGSKNSVNKKSSGKDTKKEHVTKNPDSEPVFSAYSRVVQELLHEANVLIDTVGRYAVWRSSCTVLPVPSLVFTKDGCVDSNMDLYKDLLRQVPYQQQNACILLHCTIEQAVRSTLDSQLAEHVCLEEHSKDVWEHIGEAFQRTVGSSHEPLKDSMAADRPYVCCEKDEIGIQEQLERSRCEARFSPSDVERRMMQQVPFFWAPVQERKSSFSNSTQLALKSALASCADNSQGCTARQLERSHIAKKAVEKLPTTVSAAHGEEILQRRYYEALEPQEFSQAFLGASLDLPKRQISYIPVHDAYLVSTFAKEDDFAHRLYTPRALPFGEYFTRQRARLLGQTEKKEISEDLEPPLAYAVESHANCASRGFFCYPDDGSVVEITREQGAKINVPGGITCSFYLRNGEQRNENSDPSLRSSEDDPRYHEAEATLAERATDRGNDEKQHTEECKMRLATDHGLTNTCVFMADEKCYLQHLDRTGLRVTVQKGQVHQELVHSNSRYEKELNGELLELWRVIRCDGSMLKRMGDGSTFVHCPNGTIYERSSEGGYWLTTFPDGSRVRHFDAYWFYPQVEVREEEDQQEKQQAEKIKKGTSSKQNSKASAKRSSKDLPSSGAGVEENHQNEQQTSRPEPQYVVPKEEVLDPIDCATSEDTESDARVVSRDDYTTLIYKMGTTIAIHCDGTRMTSNSETSWVTEAPGCATVQRSDTDPQSIVCNLETGLIWTPAEENSDLPALLTLDDGSALGMLNGVTAFAPPMHRSASEAVNQTVYELGNASTDEIRLALTPEAGTYTALLKSGAFRMHDTNGDGFDLKHGMKIDTYGSLAEAATSRCIARDALLDVCDREHKGMHNDEHSFTDQHRQSETGEKDPVLEMVAPSCTPRVFYLNSSGDGVELLNDREVKRYITSKRHSSVQVYSEPMDGENATLHTFVRRRHIQPHREPKDIPRQPRAQPHDQNEPRSMRSLKVPSFLELPPKPNGLTLPHYLTVGNFSKKESPNIWTLRQLMEVELPPREVAEQCFKTFEQWFAEYNTKITDSHCSVDPRTVRNTSENVTKI